jgi:hypothetical protein
LDIHDVYDNPTQGTFTEGGGSVCLTSSFG